MAKHQLPQSPQEADGKGKPDTMVGKPSKMPRDKYAGTDGDGRVTFDPNAPVTENLNEMAKEHGKSYEEVMDEIAEKKSK